ncbi:MAG: cytochrome b [Woeseiaceae bacterium]
MRWINTENHWGMITVAIHWLSALMVFGLFAFGLWMVELEYYSTWYHKAPDLHKSIGILLLVMTLLRLVWKLSNCSPVPLNSHTLIEQKMAASIHYLLYLLLIMVMLSGYLISTADGRAVGFFNWFQLPSTLHGIDNQEDIAGLVHLWLAVILISLVAIHAMAAIKHRFFDRDRTLQRMFGL